MGVHPEHQVLDDERPRIVEPLEGHGPALGRPLPLRVLSPGLEEPVREDDVQPLHARVVVEDVAGNQGPADVGRDPLVEPDEVADPGAVAHRVVENRIEVDQDLVDGRGQRRRHGPSLGHIRARPCAPWRGV